MLCQRRSGSACRSIPAGFVEWIAGHSSENSYAIGIAPPEHWDLRDVVAIVSTEEKKVGSSEGHTAAQSAQPTQRSNQVIQRCAIQVQLGFQL